MQITDTILMVRPFIFRRNEETAVNNFYQAKEEKTDRLSDLAIAEFDNFVSLLKNSGINVIVVQDTGKYDTPDSIFPNNVISFSNNKAILYPMFAENRRRERNLNYLGKLDQAGFHFDKIEDYTYFEDQNLFLEGTGVLIIDHDNKIAYCSISERSKEQVLTIYAEDQGLEPVVFHAFQHKDNKILPIYHTNVMMSLGQHFCVICLESIINPEEREMVRQKLISTNKEIIEISAHQTDRFAGNILEVKNKDGEPFICMSSQAFEALLPEQKEKLEKYAKILHAPLFSIEKYGGGSARCMMAEIFYK